MGTADSDVANALIKDAVHHFDLHNVKKVNHKQHRSEQDSAVTTMAT